MAEQEHKLVPMVTGAFAEQAAHLDVTTVSSVWAPVIERDVDVARSVASSLLDEIVERGANIDDATRALLIEVGTAVGTLSMRKLFQPFVSDQIWVDYTEASGLDQSDAVRRVSGGLDHTLASVLE